MKPHTQGNAPSLNVRVPELGRYTLTEKETRTFDPCTREILRVVMLKKHRRLPEAAVLRLAIASAAKRRRGRGLIDSHAIATAFNRRRSDRSRNLRTAANYTQHLLREEAKTGSVVCFRGKFYRLAGPGAASVTQPARRGRRPGGRRTTARCTTQVTHRPCTPRTDSTIVRRNIRAEVDAEMRAERREMTLQNQLLAWAQAQGIHLEAPDVPRRDGSEVILPDAVDFDNGEVFEAKGTVGTMSVRTAIGQVLDYKQSLEHLESRSFTPVIVLPKRPVDDLVELCSRTGIDLLYRCDGGFTRLPAADK